MGRHNMLWHMKLFSITVETSEAPIRCYKQGRVTLALQSQIPEMTVKVATKR